MWIIQVHANEEYSYCYLSAKNIEQIDSVSVLADGMQISFSDTIHSIKRDEEGPDLDEEAEGE